MPCRSCENQRNTNLKCIVLLKINISHSSICSIEEKMTVKCIVEGERHLCKSHDLIIAKLHVVELIKNNGVKQHKKVSLVMSR